MGRLVGHAVCAGKFNENNDFIAFLTTQSFHSSLSNDGFIKHIGPGSGLPIPYCIRGGIASVRITRASILLRKGLNITYIGGAMSVHLIT